MVEKIINTNGDLNDIIGTINIDDDYYEKIVDLVNNKIKIKIEPNFSIDKKGNIDIHSFSIIL